MLYGSSLMFEGERCFTSEFRQALSLPEVYREARRLAPPLRGKTCRKKERRTQTMGSFVSFMQSLAGRLLRIVAGIALIAIGLLVITNGWGIV